MSRPEDTLPPDLYYNETVSRQYTTASRVQRIQTQMTNRALELLNLDEPSHVLDIGCGSGLSGEILSDDPHNHNWVGIDISAHMLSIARHERDVEGDLFLGDMGQGLPFRPGTFDGAISISAIQWLCAAPDSSEQSSPEQRLKRFFNDLYIVLRRGGRAVCQFYPKDDGQKKMIANAAIKAGFGAGLLEDAPGTKEGKTYLVCTLGGGDIRGVVEGMDGVDVENGTSNAGKKKGRLGNDPNVKGSRAWIAKKKDKMARKGAIVKADSKYTGRKRGIKF